MKKLLLTAILLVPSVAMGDAVRENSKGNEYTWSFMAMGDTIRIMRNNCETTSEQDFVNLSNWARGKGMRFSIKELANACVNYGPIRVVRGKPDSNNNPMYCQLPRSNVTSSLATCEKAKDGDYEVCTYTYPPENTTFTNNLGCNVFISQFIDYNNKLANVLGETLEPGTYVYESELQGGTKFYEIADVVLAEGLEKNDTSAITVNSNPENTAIHVIRFDYDDYGKSDLRYRTWTNDMFLDVRNNSQREGWTAGAMGGSAIFVHDGTDVTETLMKKYAEAIRRFYYEGGIQKFTKNAEAIFAPGNTFGKVAGDIVAKTTNTGKVGKGVAGAAAAKIINSNPITVLVINVAVSQYTPKDIGPGQMLGLGLDTFDGGYFDVKKKDSWGYEGQSDTEKEGNGVLFFGKIANFDWLGHFLFAMIWGPVIGYEKMVEAADIAEKVSKFNGYESNKQHTAYKMGYDFATSHFNIKKPDTTFAERQFKNYDISEIKKHFGSGTCVTSNCGSDGDDVVVCYNYGAYDVVKGQIYIVDDLCN